jgi:UDP-glucose 4-epimerase
MYYLVTGGAGFIGSHLTDALVARGDRVLIVDDLSTGARENIEHLLASGRVEFVEGSVCDEALIEESMDQVDACFHLASAVGVELIVQRSLDSMLRNIRGLDVVTAAAARHGRRLLFTSTSEIYGKNGGSALVEDSDRILGSPSVSRWSYSTAKAVGEVLALGYQREHGTSTVVARIFNTVGPRQTGAYGMVLPRFVSQALTGEELTVYGEGSQSRCFAHVHDTVTALVMLMDQEGANGSVYNVGATREVRIIDLAQAVIERTASSSSIRRVPYEEAYGEGFEELGRRRPDTSALEGLTGWRVTRTIEDAIDDVASYERARIELAAAVSVDGHPSELGSPAIPDHAEANEQLA